MRLQLTSRATRISSFRIMLTIMAAVLVAGTIPITAQARTASVVAPDPRAQPASTIQQLVDAAATGSVVHVPAGIYRETVTIDTSITLAGQPGAEIRGSDVWSGGWKQRGGYWVRGALPEFDNSHGRCQSDVADGCKLQEQVFLDGQPLLQVASKPQPGQFAVNSKRQVVLGDDPAGRLVEVTVREYWLSGTVDNVTVQGFTMKHAANMAQSGAINNGGRSSWTIQNNTLSRANGANVSLWGGETLNLLNNDISYGGQLGVHGFEASNVVVQGNRIHQNNTDGYEPGWEAGGLKMALMTQLVLDGNEVFNNAGPGLWCDIDCNDTTIRNNRVHHNTKQGINYEISFNAKIHDNVVWENGYGSMSWGWGAGILVQNSSGVEVYNNTVAWNADGISVVSQDRGKVRWNAVNNTFVHGNSVFSLTTHPYHDFAMGWLEDWNGPLANAASNNRGEGNLYYLFGSAPDSSVFEWPGSGFSYGSLDDFNATPGEDEGTAVSADQKDQILSAVGLPAAPERGR